MISIESIEVVSIVSVWMLEPRLPELLLELKKLGYAVARVKPKSAGGYEVMFIEPNVAAIKGSTYILYDPGRRAITIEGPSVNELLYVFNEVEQVLKNVGSDPAKGVLFYELRTKARAYGDRLSIKEAIKVDKLGMELLAIPVSFVSAEGDPNTTKWFHLDIRPIWTSWTDEKVWYEIVLIYRDDKERLLHTLKSLDEVLREVIKSVSEYFERRTV